MTEEFKARFVTEPIVAPMAQMELIPQGVAEMIDWVRSRAPSCLPDELDEAASPATALKTLFPHDLQEGGRQLTDNELLVELCGRKCYNSFGAKAGRKVNSEYIANTQAGDVPHASILYHAKLSFFIAGVSRRVSHELIRNYVGADRTEEGAPSQESTRYVENAGFYVVHPRYLGDPEQRETFEQDCHLNYTRYRGAILREILKYQATHGGVSPKGIDYKRILEAASSRLVHSVETSFVWTTNPAALAKLLKERDNEAADLEFQRLARKWKRVVMAHAQNLFPQPWMREGL